MALNAGSSPLPKRTDTCLTYNETLVRDDIITLSRRVGKESIRMPAPW